jgi:hypothetical protein
MVSKLNSKLARSLMSKHGLVGIVGTTTGASLAASAPALVSTDNNMGQYEQKRMLSSTELNTKSGIQQPNRLTTIYQRMKDECPADLKAYAVCVEKANNNDELGLQQGSCQNEFNKVQECFQRTRTLATPARTATNNSSNCITF